MNLLLRVNLAVALAILAACSPSVSETEAMDLAAAGPELLARPIGEVLPPWPAPVAALRPNVVYRTDDGVRIETRRFFVEEEGVFILDPASSFVPTNNADPAYEKVSGNVYTYLFRG